MPDHPAKNPAGCVRNQYENSQRESSKPSFWDERYRVHERLFGEVPDPFLADALRQLPPASSVIDVGGGDGRNTLAEVAACGGTLTVLDFATSALDTAAACAAQEQLPFAALHADVRAWQPRKTYDAAVVAFVQLLPAERKQMYERLRKAVRPGGHIIGLWFRGDHANDAYDRIGPSKPDRYVLPGELQEAFSGDTIRQCTAADRRVQQGPVLRGHAALIQLHAIRKA